MAISFLRSASPIIDFVYVVLILAVITDVTPFYTRNKIKSCKFTTPVCGTDGKTYKNICHLQAAQSNDHDLQLFHKQSCEEDTHITSPKKTEQSTTNSNSPRGKNRKYRSIFSTSHLGPGKEYCPTYWVPVCGSDGKTYINQCHLLYQTLISPKLVSVHQGSCKESQVNKLRDKKSKNMMQKKGAHVKNKKPRKWS
ncbi:hypothetical protein evm_000581 [Chilo suppressalis]|nr:hypothetical protein evm_000581 [Chilo suppressalis]